MNKIGWIGTGKMGQRMSKHLLCEGNELYVYDIVRDNAQPLVQAGAIFVQTPAEMASCADIIFTMIPSSAVLKEIVAGENGLLKNFRPGTIIVDMSTLDPKGSSEINEIIERNGGIFMRSPVTGSTEYAEKAELGILTSGDRDAYNKILPFLKLIGIRQHYLGKGEEARYIKIAINMMIGNIAQMLAESLVLGESAGLDWETMIELFADSAAASPIIKFKKEALKKRDFTPMGTVGIMDKDMQIALEIAHEKRIALPITAVSKQYLSAMIGTGRENLDYSAVLLLNEEMNGIKHEASNI
jgi:3-hydroxyisobutyrate dehydrogenase-like beta-hydroxyacid dehydrogenase